MARPHPSLSAATRPGMEPGRFEQTRWTLVQRARATDPAIAGKALSELCELYWYPIYAFVRRTGCGPEDAKDATQGVFAMILERGDFGRADPALGKLRSYLLGTVKNFLAKQHQKAQALKRGGGVAPLSIDQARAEEQYALEPADELTPERLYERRWALTILQAAMTRLRADYEKRGRTDEFEALLPFLSWNSGEDYAAAASSLGTKSGAIRVAVHRLRKRYRGVLVEEIAHTVPEESEIDEELNFLFQVFG